MRKAVTVCARPLYLLHPRHAAVVRSSVCLVARPLRTVGFIGGAIIARGIKTPAPSIYLQLCDEIILVLSIDLIGLHEQEISADSIPVALVPGYAVFVFVGSEGSGTVKLEYVQQQSPGQPHQAGHLLQQPDMPHLLKQSGQSISELPIEETFLRLTGTGLVLECALFLAADDSVATALRTAAIVTSEKIDDFM